MISRLPYLAGVVVFALPTQALPQDANLAEAARWTTLSVPTGLVPGPVEVGLLLPPGYDSAGAALPLLLYLHGGGGNPQSLHGARGTFEAMWRTGLLPPMVVATPSAGRSFYMDFRDGSQRWESFILNELVPLLRKRFPLVPDRNGLLVAGHSMGGMGALRLAFKYPERIRAAVAWAPGVEPALSYAAIDSIDRTYRSHAVYEQIFGSPVDEAYWQANHPGVLLKTRMKEIASSGLQIYIAVGDQDQFQLYRGSELMHRLLSDAGVKHEYHLLRGKGHGIVLGSPLVPPGPLTATLEEGLRFLAAALGTARAP